MIVNPLLCLLWVDRMSADGMSRAAASTILVKDRLIYDSGALTVNSFHIHVTEWFSRHHA